MRACGLAGAPASADRDASWPGARTRRRARRGRAAGVALAALAAAACGGGEERARPAGSALWLDADSRPLTVAMVSRLAGAGIAELFVEAGTLEWQGERPAVKPTRPLRPPGRVRATLVARGNWPALEPPDASADGAAIAGGLEAIRRILEESGWLVAGWHLDLDGVASPDLLAAIRGEIDPRQMLSVTLPRDLLGNEAHADATEELLEHTDFVVCFLYGVRAGERDGDAAWDFRQVERSVRALETLGEPYLVGVVTRARAQRLRDGAPAGELAGLSVAELAWSPSLRLSPGFLLEGVDRQVYQFVARSPTRLSGVTLATGDSVRVVGASTAHLQELRRMLAGTGSRHRLGELYERVPPEGDALSLGPENVVHAASNERPAPQPVVTVEVLASGPRRTVMRVVLENASREASELAQVESNYVELRAVGGGFGDVEHGGFYRYDSFAELPGGGLRRSIRNPTVVRLFAPYLAPGAWIASGPIEVRGPRAIEDVLVRSAFLAPYGGSVETAPRSWRELVPRPAPTPAAR